MSHVRNSCNGILSVPTMKEWRGWYFARMIMVKYIYFVTKTLQNRTSEKWYLFMVNLGIVVDC